MRVLLVDNYDSFTFNLVQRIGEIDPGIELRVVRNDAITVAEAVEWKPTHVVLSPGPCTPRETGVSLQLIERFRGRVPILGVCLGHQAIAHAHGMRVGRHTRVMHGKASAVYHDGRGIFRGLGNPFQAMRYHSLIVDRESVGPDFEISAWTSDGEVMGLRWRTASMADAAPMDGVQFHPESFLTDQGPRLLTNFLAGKHAGRDGQRSPACEDVSVPVELAGIAT